MKTFSFHHKTTGLFNGSVLTLSDPKGLAANTPKDHVAMVGVFDSLSQRVDVATGKVIDYQPPRPSPDHEWNANTKRWEMSSAAKDKKSKASAALARIAALEKSQHRAIRELALGDAHAKDRLKAIDDQIQTLRAFL